MRVSVVICTYNRAKSLGETLECLRHQSYREFEVVVVNGPSTDDTLRVLRPWEDVVRIETCPLPNLSASRNIGIRAASGEVVAFIDDDALPEFDWLRQALVGFTDDEVAGVGGIVFDHTGLSLQYKYSAANRLGVTSTRTDRPYDELCAPGSFHFPYLQGTNALFRRTALLQVGGFDETYDYYLDETDLCCRLIDAGFVLRQLADAPVHHKFLPSAVRDNQRIVTNWFPIVKNHVYFSYRHALQHCSEFDVQEQSRAFLRTRIDDAHHHETSGRLPVGSSARAANVGAEAFRIGMNLGWARRNLRLGPVDWPTDNFRQFPTINASDRRKVTMITGGYTANVTGGIARFFSDLAPALARRGHEVRVITTATGPATVDLEEGVWVHRVATPPPGTGGVAPSTFEHVNAFATAALKEVERIGSWSSHDLVYGPMWDIEVLGVLLHTGLPVAVQVATPVAVAMGMVGADTNEADTPLARLIEFESLVIEQADLLHANSAAVAETILDNSSSVLDPQRREVVHLGVPDNSVKAPREPAGPGAAGRMVFFVGRFEVRKGIDTLLAAIEQIAPELADVSFVVAGEDRPLASGQKPFGATWASQHSGEPWIDRVRFPGSITDDDLHELYSSADLVVLPSRYESFGLVVVEAMMHGRAVISCDTSGIRDVVRSGVEAVLVAPGDVAGLANAIRQLLASPEERHRLGAAARARYLEHFHIDRFADRFDRFLTRLVLHDARAAACDEDETFERTNVGSVAVRLEPGGVARFNVASTSVARVAASVADPAEFEVNGRLHTLKPGSVARLDVERGATEVSVRCVEGTVAVLGVIEVRQMDES